MKIPLGLIVFSFFVLVAYLLISFLFWLPRKPKWERNIFYFLDLAPVAILFLRDENIFFVSILVMAFNAFAKAVNFPQKRPGYFKYNIFMTIIFELVQLLAVVFLVAFYLYVTPTIGPENFWTPSP